MLKFLLFATFVLASAAAGISQQNSDRIDGYKVYDGGSIKVTGDASSAEKVKVVVGDLVVSDLSLSGVTIEMPIRFSAFDQSGKVERMVFTDFRVNENAVEVGDYNEPFSFKKTEWVDLPKPIAVVIGQRTLLKAASDRATTNDAKWTVTGRMLVFGRFRKFGFYHKRVVPVEIEIQIPNPLRS